MDARQVAESWTRPYSSVQAAWVKALGVEPSATWTEGAAKRRRRRPRKRELRECMEQRHGVIL